MELHRKRIALITSAVHLLTAALLVDAAAANSLIGDPHYYEWPDGSGWSGAQQLDPWRVQFAGEIEPQGYANQKNTSNFARIILDRPTLVTVDGWVDLDEHGEEEQSAFFQFWISHGYFDPYPLNFIAQGTASETISESVLLQPGDYRFTLTSRTRTEPAYTHWDVILTIPEPSTASLLALGLIGIAATRRRRAS